MPGGARAICGERIDMEAIAKAKYLKGSPRKARLVIDLVRGKNVSQALAILKFTNKRAADPIAKVIRSAIANATYKAEQENIAIDPDDLWIKSCFVDIGPTKNRRRLRPAPQGRAYFERRHFCHITVELTSDVPEEEVKGKKAKTAASKKVVSAKKGTKAAPKAKTEKETKDVAAGEAKEAAPKEGQKADKAAKKPEPKAKSEEGAAKKQAAKEDAPVNKETKAKAKAPAAKPKAKKETKETKKKADEAGSTEEE